MAEVREPYLEVTFRHGRPLAAYLYLPRGSRQEVHSTRKAGAALVVDLDQDDVPVGIEITAPERITLAALNRVLRDYGLAELTQLDLGPLRAA